MELIRPFNKLGKHDAALAGGKGASLGEMTQAGIPVPPGYVILSQAFERFIEETNVNVEIDSILHKVKHEEMHTVENASEQIKALILEAEMPKDIATEVKKYFKQLGAKFVAVRSSATAEDSSSAAWAGQLESYLNTTEDNLLDKVKHCWASLFTPRAIFYRFEKGLHNTKISVAVVVQKMVDSEVSGIAFSVHPVTQDYNQLIIEAGFGLGEAIVSGTITPDSYVIEKEPRRIFIDKQVAEQEKGLYKQEGGGNEWRQLGERGKQQKLSDEEIMELTELILRIEKHYGFPCDIEWALEKGKFYIVQSRPITTLTEKKLEEKEEQNVRIFTRFTMRPFPLIFLEAYYDMLDMAGDEVSYRAHPLYLFDKNKNIIETYYEPSKLKSLFGAIKSRIEDEKFFNNMIKEFRNSFKKIIPFFEGKEVSTKDNLEELYNLFVTYFKGVAYTWVIPDLEGVSEDKKQKSLEARKESEPYASKRDKLFIRILQSKYPSLGDKARFIKKEEAFSNFSEKELLEKADSRSQGFIYLDRKIIEYPQIEQFLTENRIKLEKASNYDERTSTLSGKSAYGGVVRGNARIVFTYADLSKIQDKNDILVTPMTRPDFVPVMKKTAAIVTNEGGVICHAAIVARELKKPCIVGTKNATDIIKDGDLVEVDADKGIVRILKRNEISQEDIKGASKKKDKALEEITKYKWVVAAGDFNSPFIRNYLWTGGTIKIASEFKIPSVALAILSKRNDLSYLADLSTWSAAHEGIRKLVDRDLYFVDKLIDKTNKLGKNFNEWSEKNIFQPDLSKLKGEQLIELLEKFIEKQGMMYTYGAILPLLDFGKFSFVEGNLEKFLKSKLSESDFRQYYEVFTEPTHNSFGQDQEEDLLKLMSRFYNTKWVSDVKTKSLDQLQKTYPEFYRALQNHTEKHCWVYYVYNGPAYNEQNFLDFIKDYLNKNVNPGKKLKELEEKKEKVIKLKEKYLRELKPDKFNKMILELAGKIVWAKPRRKDYQSKSYYHVEKLMKEIANRLSITLEQARSAPIEMLKDAFSGNGIDKAILDSIYELHVCLPSDNGKVIILYGDKAKDFINNYIEKQSTQEITANEIKGTCACRGRAKGMVKIINKPQDMGKMQEGDILVSMATTPAVVPAMKKAAAIVTDEGGLTCHAAIVSREMNKPCVIGTKIATQVLKDGDLVEVDADKGIVRILKRNELEVKDYQRLFSHPALRFLVNDLAMQGYKGLGMVSFVKDDNFTCYMPKSMIEKTSEKGLVLYRSKKKFSDYVEGFREIYKKLRSFCDKTLSKEDFSKSQIKEFFDLCLDFISEYKKTEFIYVDRPYLESQNSDNQDLKDNLKEYEKVKFEFRNYMNVIFMGKESYYHKILEKIAKIFDIVVEDLQQYNTKEVLELFSGRKLDSKIAKERFYRNAMKDNNGNFEYYWGKEADNIINLFLKEDNEKISGIIVNKGITKGIARIIKPGWNEDFVRIKEAMERMNKGDILVSETTSPEIMIAIRKAGAIVTDQGGLMSHAAIMAREMNVPGIVGCDNATKLIKEGDLIEVDADNGLVRIINKKLTIKLGSYNDYQRLFQWKKGGLPFLVSDLFMGHYKNLDGLILFSNDIWTNFLPKEVVEKTLEDGLVLFGDAKKFTNFIAAFEEHKKESLSVFNKILSKNDATKDELEQILSLLTNTFFHYSKTEFFYTDRVFEHSKKDEKIKENIKKFEAVKNNGREFLNKIFLGSGSYLEKIIQLIGNKFSIKPTELMSYSCSELLELYNKNKVDSGKLNNRKIAFVFQANNGILHVQEGQEAREIAMTFLKDSQNKTTELKGVIANKGYAKGHVKIMSYGFENFDKLSQLIEEMQKGDVLVAETTSPELLMACKKASAILTDQGGLMSHAAIVSRELGIPCLVAMGNATELLKNGDYVEVDANNGVIRILKKK